MRAAGPKVLIFSPFFPWPQNHGDALRRLAIIDEVAKRYQTTVITIRRGGTSEADIRELACRNPSIEWVLAPRLETSSRSVTSRFRRTMQGLVRGIPPWVLTLVTPQSVRLVSDKIRTGEFSTLILLGEAAGLAARRSNLELIWDKSNVLVSSDLRAIREAHGITQRTRGALQAPLAFRFEQRVLGLVDQVWVTTTAEHERLAKYYTTPVVEVMPSVFDVPSEPAGFDPESRTLLWMGTLNYGPNWDGLKAFIRTNRTWLDTRGFTVRVIGGGASKAKERWLKAQSMVDYVGYAPELSIALRGGRIGIVPIFTGAGLKLKTLTFMGYGIPVVSTYQGMEGIPTDAAAAVVKSMDEFPGAITNLSSDSLFEASRDARTMAHDMFSTTALGARIDDALQKMS